MEEPVPPSPSARLFERNDALVVEAFRGGAFDYIEGVGEVSEADFFRAITSRKVLDQLAATYPSPHQKHDVPLWVYIAGDISMLFLMWYGPAGWLTPLVRRWVIRLYTRKREM